MVREMNFSSSCFDRRFPHVVNLACKAVISAIANIRYPPPDLNQDPIVALRTLIRAVSVNIYVSYLLS